MAAAIKSLSDDGARRDAIRLHDRSMLVEAGAGSGKTAVMAGRIAFMLAEGAAPRSIAAVTFTELAASELVLRVREFVADLSTGKVADELRIALPDSLSQAQRENLVRAMSALDEITCTTIHGFCQRLIKPYPAEANIDPGAKVADRSQADLAFLEIFDAWLRERLSGEADGLLAEMVQERSSETVTLIRKIAENLRSCPSLSTPPAPPLKGLADAFRQSVGDFNKFVDSAIADEPETINIVRCFSEMANALVTNVDLESSSGLVRLLTSSAHADLCTKSGGFAAYRKKSKWVEAAKQAGLAKADAERLNIAAESCYDACRLNWMALQAAAASQALSTLVGEAGSIVARYRDYKRNAALLDFDDLIFAARDLLRDHDAIRRALGQRFAHVLVDEFQDTDPLQTEIFWRLCGDPQAGVATDDWREFRIRPGALFLVGDPKQAIYRFRGADVGAYVAAREALGNQDPAGLLSISTNFRSAASILTYVNERFKAVLSSDGQPGFTPLDPFHVDRNDACVVALDIALADDSGKATAQQRRDAEAEAVADLCLQLIGGQSVVDRRTGNERLCQPGDIALLAPTGSELWRYEEALERRGIPVATQAGKGLFRRQEIQDLIALTRALVDRRDTLALGALLRGPLVGLTEEELLDIVWALPRSADEPNRIPRLDLSVDADTIANRLARETIKKLQALYRRTNSTTPYNLLSQAVDVMKVRPILLDRHHGQVERALANVDLYLSFSRAYAVRGLRAFAEAMTAAWTEEERAIEGRPDAQEEAVSLFTMHASKGLEWPIVMPINTMTGVIAPEAAVIDRRNNILHCPVFGIQPAGYEDAREAEKAELDRERVRLWYVAATRARELLVLPRLDAVPNKSAWISIIDLSLANLPAFALTGLAPERTSSEPPIVNPQTREIFASEAAAILNGQMKLEWRQPSREENGASPVSIGKPAAFWSADEEEPASTSGSEMTIRGGRLRGNILHKLLEEVLTGETSENPQDLTARARELILMLGQMPASISEEGLSPDELASCVVRTMALPEIEKLRHALVPEFAVYGMHEENDREVTTAGFVDAMTLDADGHPSIVIDWKSDVNPRAETLDHYRAQVREYLRITGADQGLIVLLTQGSLIKISYP